MKNTVELETVQRFVRALGFEPRDVREVVLTPARIVVLYFARGEQGVRMNADGGPQTLEAHIWIV